MKRTVFTISLLFAALSFSTAHAQSAAVAVDAPADMVAARAMQVLTLQALADEGVEAGDPEALRQPLTVAAATVAATEAGATRLFVLHLAPLTEAVLASLEEVNPADGKTLARASLMIQSEREASRALARLAHSVLTRTPIAEGQLVSTVTESEAVPYAKKPGEFLYGITVLAGFGAGDLSPVPGIYGATFRFFYEMPHVNFGITLGGGGSEDAGFYETTVRAHYLFSESDTSGYLGGGLGISFITEDDHEAKYGAHVTISGGVEAFRLHSVRLLVGIDVLLPTYVLDGETKYDYTDGKSIERTTSDAYVVIPTFTVGVMF